MTLWDLIHIIDWILFAIIAATVLYLSVFAIASLYSRRHTIPRTKKQNRFVILIPSYKQDKVIEQAVISVLSQAYPQPY